MFRIAPLKTKEDEEKAFHLMSFDELKRKFDINLSKGLDSSRVVTLRKKYGKNQIKVSYFRLVKAVTADLFDYLSIMLWISAIMSVLSYKPFGSPPLLSNLITAIILFASLFAKACLAFYQSFNSIESLRGFHSSKECLVHVMRDGETKLVSSFDLVIGDLVFLLPNNRVPAVLRLIEVKGLVLDKSALTGETGHVEATSQKYNIDNKVDYIDASNMAFTNCLVVHGEGLGVVVALCTDELFGFGQISQLDKKKSSYSLTGGVVEELGRFVLAIMSLSVLGVILYVVFYLTYIQPTYSPPAVSTVNDILQILISGIPFGMPVTVTVALFFVSIRLKKRHILVKDVFAIDSLGSIDVIITDKTGTLTTNELQVANVMQGVKEMDPDSCYYDPVIYMGVQRAVKELLLLCHFNKNKLHLGDSIDTALYKFSKKNLQIYGLSSAYKEVEEIVFNSANKYQVKLLRPSNKEVHQMIFDEESNEESKFEPPVQKIAILIARGAPEVMLKKSSRILEADGSESEMTENKNKMIRDKLLNWSFRGRRVVALCRLTLNLDALPFEKGQFATWFRNDCNYLCFVGLVGFVDPPKQDISNTIQDIRKLGIRIVMATGDYSVTAGSIAKQVGILSTEKYDSIYRMRQPNRTNRRNSILINGSELDTITREEWWTICHDYEEIVLSRTTPQHKLKCVKEFQENNFSVLMVGDGANDVLALKSANISVAMSSGNRIAADISDIVLLDNDFACIYKIILTGKQTLDNVKKMFLHFTVVSAFSQAFTCIISTIFGLPNLFSVYASTIICMITDGIPATTFIFEKSRPKNALEASESEEKNSIKERIVDWRLLIMGCVSRGPLTTLFLYGNFFIYVYYHTNHTVQDFIFNYKNITDPRAVLTMQSISFYSVVVIQCFGNIWAIRSLHVSIFKISPFHGYYRNLPMVISTFIMLLIGIGLICIPTANNLLGTTPIPIGLYFIPFGYAIFIIAMNEFRIFLRDRFNFKEKYFWW